MIYLKTFKLSNEEVKNYNIYPYNIIKNKEPDILVFDNLTVLYGNNGSGKSTLLNIIANKLNLKGRERSSPNVVGEFHRLNVACFERFISKCEYSLGEYDYNKPLIKIPEASRYIKSEETLYEIRKIQQDEILEESYVVNHIKNGMNNEQAKNMPKTEEGYIQLARFAFAQEKYSNGETTMQFLDEYIEPNCLYLLDEPEVSLSPQNQIQLAKKINEMSRYLNVQFIIATHSPFMLGVLEAKIYNMDTKNYQVQEWSSLENVRYFYDFFKKRKNEFE